MGEVGPAARFTLSLLARAPRRLSHTYSPRTLFPSWSGRGRGPLHEFRMMACFSSPLTSSTWKDIKWQEMEKAALLRDAGQLCANSSPLAVTLGPQKVRAPSPLNPTGPPPPGFPCFFTRETHCDFLSRGFPRPAHPLLPGRVWANTPLGAPPHLLPHWAPDLLSFPVWKYPQWRGRGGTPSPLTYSE